MPFVFTPLRGPVGAAFFLALCGTGTASAQSPKLDFERTFAAAGEPAALHYKAVYEDARGRHELEVWRDGQTRLRRRTDGKLDIYVMREADGELRLTLLDHTRRIRSDVSRSSLYRLGHPSDWFALAHGIGKPRQEYVLRPLERAPLRDAPLAPCRWYRLAYAGRHSDLCWSKAYHLPLLIADAEGGVHWKIVTAATGRFAPALFQVEDGGYLRVNADEDLSAD